MRRPLLQLLIAFTLLMQGVGSAWAATRMAAGEVQVAAHMAELPPCHREAAQAAQAERTEAAMPCCGSASCHCVMGCGVLPALALAATGALVAPAALLPVESASADLQAGHYGPALRPPATLQR